MVLGPHVIFAEDRPTAREGAGSSLMIRPESMWPPLRRLTAQAPADALRGCRALRTWAEQSADSLACLRLTQEVLEGVLLLKAGDPRMSHWARVPANCILPRLATEDLETVFTELTSLNLTLGRLGLLDWIDATSLLEP